MERETQTLRKILLRKKSKRLVLAESVTNLKNIYMEKQNEIKIFENKKVRTLWDAEEEKWVFINCRCC